MSLFGYWVFIVRTKYFALNSYKSKNKIHQTWRGWKWREFFKIFSRKIKRKILGGSQFNYEGWNKKKKRTLSSLSIVGWNYFDRFSGKSKCKWDLFFLEGRQMCWMLLLLYLHFLFTQTNKQKPNQSNPSSGLPYESNKIKIRKRSHSLFLIIINHNFLFEKNNAPIFM